MIQGMLFQRWRRHAQGPYPEHGTRRVWGLCVLALVLVGGVCRGDGPAASVPGMAKGNWVSFRGDVQRTGVAGSALPEKLRKLWKYEAGEGIDSTAAIVGERVYVGTEKGRVLALNLADGTLVWEFKAGGRAGG